MIASPAATALPVHQSPAAQAAERNWAANVAAIRTLQPAAADIAWSPDEPIEWLFGRDGALTAMLPGDRWWAGCSVPLAAARFMLSKMDAAASVSCFLSPTHAAQVRVALDRLERNAAIIAIVPDATTLWVMLHCEDFSEPIAAHRLWFAAGDAWETKMERLLAENPGLCTPSLFLRPILADPQQADDLITPAQRIFAAENTRRAERVAQLVSTRSACRSRGRVCLIAPSHFRLWDPSSESLSGAIDQRDAAVEVLRCDPDDPASASPLALASLVGGCDAVIAANIARADVPGVAAADVSWITWVTTPRVPSHEGAGPNDHLLLADPQWQSSARALGWPEGRLRVARWPAVRRGAPRPGATLALIADTQPLQPPKKVEDFSSHKLLWEMIGEELLNDPYAVGDDVEKYLSRRMSRLQIAEAGLDRKLFVDRLIVPACQQGIARLLVGEGIAVDLHGKGWDGIDPLSSSARGPVRSSAEFEEIVEAAAALVHPWPSRHAHPIDAAGCPVLRAFGRHRDAFLRDAQAMLKDPARGAESSHPQALGWASIAPLLVTP